MSRRQVIILVAAALIVIAGIILGILSMKDGGFLPGGEKQEGKTDSTEGVGETIDGTVPVFSNEVPENAELTEPSNEAPAAPGVEERDRAFKIAVNENGFTPSNITVNVGDVVRMSFTAQGDDYDVQIPYTGHYISVKNGETKQITLGINTVGTYNFSCRDLCPGKTISGSLIVLP